MERMSLREVCLFVIFFLIRQKGEGFFLAALRKPDSEDEPATYSFSKAKSSKKKDKKGGAAASPVSKDTWDGTELAEAGNVENTPCLRKARASSHFRNDILMNWLP